MSPKLFTSILDKPLRKRRRRVAIIPIVANTRRTIMSRIIVSIYQAFNVVLIRGSGAP